ncbi:MAG: LysR family transcriptional regulator [Thermodesulfobacteriota bacterium]
MNLRKLESLVSLAEFGSLTAASLAVNLTQSAVSQQIKDLEEELGLLLLDRSRRPISFTKEGEELVEVSQQLFKLWNDYKDRTRKAKFEGKLVLGYVRSALTGLLANALILLREKHPHLTIKLVNAGGVTKELAKEVERKKIDASFGVGPFQVPRDVQWRPYAMERYFVIAPKTDGAMTDEELLTQGPYLRFKPHLLVETIIDREVKRRGIRAEAVMELDSYESIILMVEHDIGVGIVPESYLTAQWVAKLKCLPFSSPPLTREMGIMVRNDNPRMPLVDLLWEALRKFSNFKKRNAPTNRLLKASP